MFSRFHLLFRLCRREDIAYVLYKRSRDEKLSDRIETRQGRFRFEMEFDENYLPSADVLYRLYNRKYKDSVNIKDEKARKEATAKK